MRDLTDVTLVSEDHNGPDNHNECDDLDYHDDHDDCDEDEGENGDKDDEDAKKRGSVHHLKVPEEQPIGQ